MKYFNLRERKRLEISPAWFKMCHAGFYCIDAIEAKVKGKMNLFERGQRVTGKKGRSFTLLLSKMPLIYNVDKGMKVSWRSNRFKVWKTEL